jgi:transcriptional regulator with XRE-family HTH domain
MSFGSKIKELRKEAGLSQQEVAGKLGMARATYASLEVDRREPDLSELWAIAKFYEIPLIELVAEEGDDWPGVISEPTPEYKTRKEPEIEPRNLSPQVSPEKLREVLLYVLGKVGAKPTMGETVLYKLLYFIDFDYYEKYGESITGLTYVSNEYGPTPTIAFVDVVKQMEANKELEVVSTKYFNNRQKKYLPIVPADLQALSAKELQHIDQELTRLGDKTAIELLEFSQHGTPWLAAKQDKPLQYRDVFYRTIRTAVTQ